MILNERILRLVIAVSEELHFGRAAARLHVSQPALSGTIKVLEEELGARLFRRTYRNVEMTEAGQVFVGEARRLLDESMLAVALVKRSSPDITGSLRIGYLPSIDSGWIWSLTSGARLQPASAPHFEFVSLDAAGWREAVIRGTLHAAIVTGSPRDNALDLMPLFRQPLTAVLPATNPLAETPLLSLRSIEDTPIVLLRRDVDPFLRESLFTQFSAQSYKPNIVQEVSNFFECLQFAREGLGAAFLPVIMRPAEENGSVVFRDFPPGTLELGYILASLRGDAPPIRQFTEFALNHLPPGISRT